MNLLLPSTEWKNKPNKQKANHIPSLVMGAAHSCQMVNILTRPHGVISQKIVTVMRTSNPINPNCILLHGKVKFKSLTFGIINVSEETTAFMFRIFFLPQGGVNR
jgi:hypothetical protein